MTPEVSEEEGSYALRFYCWFLESFKNCLLLLVAYPGLIDTLAQLLAWRSLLWLLVTWRQKLVDPESFSQRYITSLIFSITFVVLLIQEKENTVKGNKHTHTHTVASSHLKHESLIKALNIIVGWRKFELMFLNLIFKKIQLRHGEADQLNGYLNNIHLCTQGGAMHRFYCHLRPGKRVS